MSVARLIFHFVGNIAKWLYYLGKKSMDEVAKDDNSTIGLIILILIVLISYSFK